MARMEPNADGLESTTTLPEDEGRRARLHLRQDEAEYCSSCAVALSFDYMFDSECFEASCSQLVVIGVLE